jgi:hypothetical protein
VRLLFTATVTHYERLTGTKLHVDRTMAWHLRTVLGDALWRAEARDSVAGQANANAVGGRSDRPSKSVSTILATGAILLVHAWAAGEQPLTRAFGM